MNFQHLGETWRRMQVRTGGGAGGADAPARRPYRAYIAAFCAAVLLLGYVISTGAAPDPPTQLRADLAAAAASAEDLGALHPLATVGRFGVEQEGVLFVVTRGDERELESKRAGNAAAADPFADPDPLLTVQLSPAAAAGVGGDHRLLLNKFPSIREHALLVTAAFRPQAGPLDAGDWAAWWYCVQELDALGFFNSAPLSGASQAHRHMQLIPVDKLPTQRVPVAAAVLAAAPRRPWTAFQVPQLPFEHSCWRVERRAPDAARRLHDATSGALRELAASGTAYNLLLTQTWAMLVPRAAPSAGGLDVNALGFAGLLLSRGEAAEAYVRSQGPLGVLEGVTFPPQR